LAWQVFRGSAAIRRGLLSRHQLRGASWIRLRHDVYADARLDRDHTLACRAALLRLPAGTVIAGPSAAYLHGVTHAAGFTDDVHVLLPATARADAQPGLRIHHAPLPGTRGDLPAPAGMSGGPDGSPTGPVPPGTSVPTGPVPPGTSVPTGPPARSRPAGCAWETAVWTDPVRAVGVIDGLLRAGVVDRAGLAAEAARNAGRPGGRRASWVFGLTDAGAQSPPESHLRVRLVLAGLPKPVTRPPVRVPAGPVLHPGLAWPQFRVAVEHDGRRPAHPDRTPLGPLAEAGWLVLPGTDQRLHHEFPVLVRELRAALVSRGWRP
jgi:hypothetical protein